MGVTLDIDKLIETLTITAAEQRGQAEKLCQLANQLSAALNRWAAEPMATRESVASAANLDGDYLTIVLRLLHQQQGELSPIIKELEGALPKLAKLAEVEQVSEPFEGFTRQERTIHGSLVVEKSGTKAPWPTSVGVGVITIFGIRRRNGRVEFGIGSEKRPILDWVTPDRFHPEWPT